jgi:prepilin-type N-terminal cleavage/methylation domain-containing protein
VRAGFTLIELLVTIAIIAVLVSVAAGVVPGMIARANSADALAKIRQMGAAVMHYPSDHNGLLPPLFPGQVLEYEAGRGGRIVTECVTFLGIDSQAGKYLVAPLMPRAYGRLDEPKDKNRQHTAQCIGGRRRSMDDEHRRPKAAERGGGTMEK